MTTVFIPLIGFRPAGTRTLREPVEATEDGSRVVVHALAAAPDRTDVVVEWQRFGDPVTCPPGSTVLVHSNTTPLANGLAAELVAGTATLDAASAARRGYHMSNSSIGAIDELRFPALPAALEHAELRLRDGATEWRMPFSLVLGGIDARPLAARVAQDGVVIRATAMCRQDDELIVEVVVEAAAQIRQVAGALPTSQRFLDTTSADHISRTAVMRRVFGDRARPIALEDDRGIRHDEVGRLLSYAPQQAAPGQPFISHFCVTFYEPDRSTEPAALVIPFVELNNFGPSAVVDLRDLPREVELSEHRFRVTALEERESDRPTIVLELAPSADRPRFMQPARVHGADAEFGWQRQTVEPELPGGRVIRMATKLGDPPIVTFSGVVLRVDGPMRLDLHG